MIIKIGEVFDYNGEEYIRYEDGTWGGSLGVNVKEMTEKLDKAHDSLVRLQRQVQR